MRRLFLLVCFCGNCTILRAEKAKISVSSNDSNELRIRIVETNKRCHVTHLIEPSFSFELISNDGTVKSFTIKSKDSIIKIPSVYSVISVPAEGFLYGRKCYYKIKKENEVIIEDNIPVMQYGKDSNSCIYSFWSLFYKRCPYYGVNRLLFESNLNNAENKQKLYNLRKFTYHEALTLLDSMKNSMNADGYKEYSFLRQILKYEWLADCLLMSQQVKVFYQTDPEFIGEISDFDKLKNDSLINFPTYQNFLQSYLERVLLNDSRLQVNSHGFTYRYFDALDKIKSLPASFSKQYLIKYCLKKTEENFDSKIVLQAISKEKNSGDTSVKNLIHSIEQRIKMRDQLKKNINEFVTIDLKLYSLLNIIEANKGKVLYVDIWASWCIPCRAAMPYSLALRKFFKDQKVAFIYFSVDEDFDKWKAAVKKENLDLYPYSYKAANPQSNIFLHSINAKEIPRYLIFDKRGRLVHSNAPGPDSEEIRKLLGNYLND